MVTGPVLPILVFLLSTLAASTTAAQTFEAERRWLGPVGDLGATLAERARLPLAPLSLDPERAWLERLGFALFRSPDLFGETARRAGLSCHVCHPGGGANRRFFVDGLSIKPGTFDGTSAAFDVVADDGRFNPLTIPGLAGVTRTAPFGHLGDFADLRAFAHHVIVEEFGGAAPDRLALDALVAHMERLSPPNNRHLDNHGRLSASVPGAARAGEAVFHRPFPGRSDMSCATCHAPSSFFAGGGRHDVDTGGLIDTPSLRRGDLRPPFMHDGRFDRLGDVVAHFDSHFRLGLDPSEQANLVAYLEALAGEEAVEQVTLVRDLDVIGELVLAADGSVERRKSAALASVIGAVRRELGHIHERFFGEDMGLLEARQALIRVSASFREVERRAEVGDWAAAVEWLRRARDELDAARPMLEAVVPRSLYDPGLLARMLAARPR